MARATAAQRGYGSARWKKARATHLKREPFCRLCAERGKRTKADTVDHIKPHRGDSRLFWDTSNWQSLCRTCHSSVKQRLEATGVRPGCDEDGLPLDSSHHWRGEGG